MSELDPIYLHRPASQRPRFNSRHAVFQVNCVVRTFADGDPVFLSLLGKRIRSGGSSRPDRRESAIASHVVNLRYPSADSTPG